MLGRLYVLLSLAIAICPFPAGSITSGWPALEREFQSAVLIWTIEDNKPKYLCTGVLIAPDTVATAAACVYTETHLAKSPTLFISTSLKIDFKVPLAQALQNVTAIAKKGIRHHEADLMLIFLNQPLLVDPAIILSATETFQIRLLNQVILAGYGLAEAPREPTKVSRIWETFGGGEKAIEPGEKLIAKSKIVSVSNKELLLAKTPEDGTACSGDEGGPVFAHIDTPFDNSQRVLGIIAASSQLAKCAQPSTAIRLDAYREFINEKMTLACKKKERVWCKTEGLQDPNHAEQNEKDEDSEIVDETLNQPKTETAGNKQERPKEESPPQLLQPQREQGKDPQSPKPQHSKPQPKPAPKPAKRRLSVAAEGAGCSCQQVFTPSR